MNAAQKVLIFGGLILAAFGMFYGLHYAIFVEHQTLDRMGGSLLAAFVHAAEGHLPEAESTIESYASTKYDYVRQVDVHSHWIGLAMLLMLMGVMFDHVAFSLRVRFWIAVALLAGGFVFPLGVLLQTLSPGAFFASALAVLGSALVTIALAAVAWGLAVKGPVQKQFDNGVLE
jgi:hypothetical protein